MGNGDNPKGIPNLGLVMTGPKCPVLNTPVMQAPGKVGFAISSCIRGECAYFNALRNECRVVSIDQKLVSIDEKLGSMVNLLTKLVKQEVSDAKRG
jgi:hypothetical protein